MRTRVPTTLALATTLLAVAGCSKSPRDRLQGRWLGESIANAPQDQSARATGWVTGTAIDFSGSKVTVTIPAESPRSGTFKVTKTEGDQVTVAFMRPEGTRDEAQFTLGQEDRTLRWAIGGGQEIVLAKAQN
ncbi:hypothetical protein [Chondromyces apiculatus]|uniref:Lipocalin-like domain-containing protein n=1 Tax=Chondromyces apiculatus DSM 436 TaxID=1192034 RepID=A0A017T3N0_9BACT|nr:hypothetical protein [Chondromyces apiculatus]EYF03572.1 Hypothetical protein CAP_5363 [Chondromyces apiculatus DSM 436]